MAKAPTKSDDEADEADVETSEETAAAEQPEPPASPRADAIPIEPNPVEASEPYPTGSPPDPAEEFRRIHGYDKPAEE